MYSKSYEIISLENCLDAAVPHPHARSYKRVTLFPCHGLGGNQKWYYSPVSGCSTRTVTYMDNHGF